MKTRITMRIMICLFFVLIPSLVFAQGSDEAVDEDDGKIVLDVEFMFDMESPSDAKGVAVNKAVERMKEDHPEIEVRLNTVSHDDYQTRILTLAAADSLPDIFNIKGSWVKNMVENDHVGALDKFFEKDPDWYNQFIPDAFNDMTYQGSIYGAPFQMLTTGNIFYNKAIFAEAGYDEFPETWDEYIKALKSIKELGYTPISMGNRGLWVANSCYFGTLGDRAAGEEWFYSIMDNSGASFTDPEIILAAERFQQLAEIGAFNTDMNSLDNSQQRAAYYNGKAASFFDGNWAIADIINKCPQEILDVTGIALLPVLEDGKGEAGRVAGGSAWGNAYSSDLEGEKLEAAITFLKYVTDNEYGADLLDAGDFPGVKVSDYDKDRMHPFVREYYELRNTWTMAPQYDCQFDPSVIDAMNIGFQQLLTNTITPEEWGEKVQKEYERIN